VVRGDVHAVALPRDRGRVQHGKRYAVIVQADALLALSTVVICPTSQSAPTASFHPEIDVGGARTRVMCEMAGAVTATKLGDRIGHLSVEEMAGVNEALELVLELS
jgi:mRNA interferase MazF